MAIPSVDGSAIAEWRQQLLAGDRRALARAITLAESTRPDHQATSEALIESVLPQSGKALRLGISGVPGVGKSTFIESFGMYLLGQGHRLAVLAVDPSSRLTGGSILGDKTRMAELASDKRAFIRPSPSGGTLGGVARRTREAIVLCEAAGFDVIIVETVGVGQSETTVADMVDMFCLLLLPAGGDELQGIKKGIVELADLIIVNKADGDLREAAQRAVGDYRSAVRLLRPGQSWWRAEVMAASALQAEGLSEIWATIQRYLEAMDAAGARVERRARQAEQALWADLGDRLIDTLRQRPAIQNHISEIEKRVRTGLLTPMAGARRLLGLFLGEEQT